MREVCAQKPIIVRAPLLVGISLRQSLQLSRNSLTIRQVRSESVSPSTCSV